jgi:hypothetical protein
MFFSGPVIPDWKTNLPWVSAALYFFETTTSARAWYQHTLSSLQSAPPKFARQLAGRAFQVERNVYISWGSNYQVPTKRVNAIVHACLRTG